MPPEVVAAMEQAAKHFVPLTELQRKVGGRIAELLGLKLPWSRRLRFLRSQWVPLLVSPGVIQKSCALPDTTGMKNEIVQQKTTAAVTSSRCFWSGRRSFRWRLGKTRNAINDRTAMMFLYNEI